MSKKIMEEKTIEAKKTDRKKMWIWIAAIAAVVAIAVTVVCLVAFRPIPTDVPAQLDACIRDVLYEVHYSDHTVGKYPALTYTTLCVEEKDDTTTVYGVMMYCEYTRTTHGELRTWGSANEAFAITAKKTDKGYEATECWWPKLGKEYVPSIEEKFPRRVRDKACNAYQYYAAHDAVCKAEAEKNITDADKYVVMQSEAETLRLAYCPAKQTAYVIFVGGYATDGTYVQEDGKMVFTFGENKVTLLANNDAYVYTADESSTLPKEWVSAGSREYFTDGSIFHHESAIPSAPEDPKNTATVGPVFTAASSAWMSEEDLQAMFGQYVPQSFDYAASDNHYLPVRPIETRDQLDRFIAAYADSWTDIKAENFAQYDEVFFENNYLMMTYYRNGMASCEPKVSEYVYVQDGSSLWLSVRLEVTQPAAGDTVVGQWLLFSGIAKEDYKKATGLEAYAERVVTKEDAIYSGTNLSFTGKVKQVEGRSMLMQCYDVGKFFQDVWVELGDIELDPMVGEEYVVTYEDVMMPSLPPRITAITVTKP